MILCCKAFGFNITHVQITVVQLDIHAVGFDGGHVHTAQMVLNRQCLKGPGAVKLDLAVVQPGVQRLACFLFVQVYLDL